MANGGKAYNAAVEMRDAIAGLHAGLAELTTANQTQVAAAALSH